MADLALRVAAGNGSAQGHLQAYDGLADRLRSVEIAPRLTCPLCGPSQSIFDIDETRYTTAICAA
jgi:hypothetical protein